MDGRETSFVLRRDFHRKELCFAQYFFKFTGLLRVIRECVPVSVGHIPCVWQLVGKVRAQNTPPAKGCPHTVPEAPPLSKQH